MTRTAPTPRPARALRLCSTVAGLVAGLAGCGSPTPGPAHPAESERDGFTPESAWHACADTRSDYRRVAEYRCADGSVPLRGDMRAGGAARTGNIGAGPDGHILDRYEVPCPEGTVVLFVDLYHCDEESGPLTDAEIEQAMADLDAFLRAPEESSPAVLVRARRAFTQLGLGTPDCGHLLSYLVPPASEYPAWRSLGGIYVAGTMAALYEDRSLLTPGLDPAVRAGVEGAALRRGALLMVHHYRRLVAAGYTDLRHPQLERLAAISEEQLGEEIDGQLAACALEALMPGTRVVQRD